MARKLEAPFQVGQQVRFKRYPNEICRVLEVRRGTTNVTRQRYWQVIVENERRSVFSSVSGAYEAA